MLIGSSPSVAKVVAQGAREASPDAQVQGFFCSDSPEPKPNVAGVREELTVSELVTGLVATVGENMRWRGQSAIAREWIASSSLPGMPERLQMRR